MILFLFSFNPSSKASDASSLLNSSRTSVNRIKSAFKSIKKVVVLCCPSIILNLFSSEQSRSEEHTSELQSRGHLVCRLLLEKKKIQSKHGSTHVATRAH